MNDYSLPFTLYKIQQMMSVLMTIYGTMLMCLQTKMAVFFLFHTDHGNITKVLGCVHNILDHLIFLLPFFSVPSGALEMPLFSELPPLCFQIDGCACFQSSQFLKNNANQVENIAFKAFF